MFTSTIQQKKIDRRAPGGTGTPAFAALAIVATDAPEAALHATLDALRPATQARLVATNADGGRRRYRLELALPPQAGPREAIDMLARVKAALEATIANAAGHRISILET